MVSIQVPKGIDNGMQIRYENLLKSGSLVIEYRIDPDLRFDRRGADLYHTQPISVLDLIVGANFEFATISGKVFEVKIPPKTQPHMQLKIAGQGMPIYGSPHYGDQIILIRPIIPDIIDTDIIESIVRSKNK
jgi:DnaJ-class molecular chaperone